MKGQSNRRDGGDSGMCGAFRKLKNEAGIREKLTLDNFRDAVHQVANAAKGVKSLHVEYLLGRKVGVGGAYDAKIPQLTADAVRAVGEHFFPRKRKR